MDRINLDLDRLGVIARDFGPSSPDWTSLVDRSEGRRAIIEELEDLRDQMNFDPSIQPPAPNDTLAREGLAIVVGHTRVSPGADGLAPPFPIGSNGPQGALNHEYAWNTDLAMRISERATRAGVRCHIFFRDNGGIPAAYANVRLWAPEACVELHFNSANGTARGTEVLYGADDSEDWALTLQRQLATALDREGRTDRGIKFRRQGERGFSSVTQFHPSALIEPFFGDNASDARLGIDRKDKIADAILAAFAQITGRNLQSSSNRDELNRPRLNDRPASDLPDVPLLRDLIATYRTFTPAVRDLPVAVIERLKGVTLAQWILESGWAQSDLAAQHFNFGGMKGNSEVAAILRDVPASIVRYVAHDGLDNYLKFGSLRDFIRGYFMFLDRSPYVGWDAMAQRSAHDFIRLIARKWTPTQGYAARVIGIERQLIEAGVLASDGTLPATETGARPESEGSAGAVDLRKVALNQPSGDFLGLVWRLFDRADLSVIHPAIVAQWALESDWGRADLARVHMNFAGMEWSELFSSYSVSIPHPGNPALGQFCRFLSARDFEKAYFARLERDHASHAWSETSDKLTEFAKFLGASWRPNDPDYATNILDIAARITTGSPTSPGMAGEGHAARSVNAQGVVLRLDRIRSERRPGGGERTVGTYQLFIDGREAAGISGTFFESHGPGDNSPMGRARQSRIKAGKYPLVTHSGGPAPSGVTKYKTIDYTSSTADGAMPRPSIRLGNTQSRSGILIHPGKNFLWSVGCLNASEPLPVGGNMIYADSRSHVIALIDTIRAALGTRFPRGNNQRIPDAFIEISGEPGPSGTDTLGNAGALDRSGYAREELVAASNVLLQDTLSGVAVPDDAAHRVEFYDALTAKMLAASVLGEVEDGTFDRLTEAGADLAGLRNAKGETLWVPWTLARAAAEDLPDVQRDKVVERLQQIGKALQDGGVPTEDDSWRSPMVSAAISDSPAALTALLDFGAALDRADGSGLTPLLAAAYAGAPDSVAFLLERGADPRRTVAPGGEDEALAELPEVGSDATACALAGAAEAHGQAARVEDYDQVADLLWNAMNPE